MAVTAADTRAVDQLLSVIRDGGQPRYLLFWGHQPPPTGGVGKGCLSQWWPAAFTAEHRFEVVVTGNMAKFGQHPQLRDFLAGTGSRVLAEASPRDLVRGIGLAAGDERAGSPERWQGLNLLGFALVDGNGDGSELEAEAWAWRDGAWHGPGSSGAGRLDRIGPARTGGQIGESAWFAYGSAPGRDTVTIAFDGKLRPVPVGEHGVWAFVAVLPNRAGRDAPVPTE